MSRNKKVVIIGAGVGGLTTGIYLAQKGYQVSIYEKNAYIGGRCSHISKDGHRFDIGATLLMMPDLYEKAYQKMGKNLYDELDLIRMSPIYKIIFPDGENISFSSDLKQLQQQLERIEPGSFNSFLKYMHKSYDCYKVSMKHIIDRNYFNPLQFYSPKNVGLLMKLRAFKNHYAEASKYFKSEYLRIVFTFQNIYVGQNPFTASAIFSMLPFLELTDGVYFPKGGMTQITKNLEKIAKDEGVEIFLNSPVEKITTQGKKVSGVLLQNGNQIDSDIVVANADLPSVYKKLLPESRMQKKINNMKYTCSAFVFHWGMKKEYQQLDQHNVFVSNNYHENIRKVFTEKTVPEDTSFYVHSPVKTDKSVAPDGGDSLSIIVPVGHYDKSANQDWKAMKEEARDGVIRRLKKEGLTDIEENIKFEVCYTPYTWDTLFNLEKGAVFGSLSHNIMQMGYSRLRNKHDYYKNLIFTGGSTHPGNGVPMVLISSRLTSERIIKNN